MLSYNANHERVKMQISDGDNVTLTRYYLNGIMNWMWMVLR